MKTTKLNKTGVVLAAGLGSRMSKQEADDIIKPLTEIDSLGLLLRTIYSLEKASCIEIVIVLGWKADEIQNNIRKKYKGNSNLQFIYNSNYKLSNGISVLCAKDYVRGEFILTMADHILDDRIMNLVKNHNKIKSGAVLCVDYKIDTIFDIDDATKVFEEKGSVTKIGKAIKHYNCIDTGVFICSIDLMNALERIYSTNGDVSLSEGVQSLADKGKMRILDIGDAYWQDIDNIEMLNHAKKLLL